MVDTDIKWTTEGEVEMVVTEDTDKEIVWDSVERALANFSSNRPLENKKGVVHTLLN